MCYNQRHIKCGSILGPLLLYVNDVKQPLNEAYSIIFANNTKQVIHSKCHQILLSQFDMEILSHGLNSISIKTTWYDTVPKLDTIPAKVKYKMD